MSFISHFFNLKLKLFLIYVKNILKNDHNVNIKAANILYEYKSWNIQEVHDVEAFERGAANAASVRRQARSPFPLKFHDILVL
jgi:hypothetical protein